MDYFAKQTRIEKLSKHASQVAEDAFNINREDLTELYRGVMKKEELLLWDLMTFWEKESLKAVEVEAHFSAMISAVSMNEALICYVCLVHEDEVRSSQFFKKISGVRKDKSLAKWIADWKLKSLVQVASELNWIPRDVIDTGIASMMGDVLREMREDPLPSDFTFSTEEFEALLTREPGVALVELTQSLRNYVHPTRWLRLQDNFKASSFALWCQIATRISGEIRNTLLVTALEGQAKRLRQLQNEASAFNAASKEEKSQVISLALSAIAERTGIVLPDGLDLQGFMERLLEGLETIRSESRPTES